MRAEIINSTENTQSARFAISTEILNNFREAIENNPIVDGMFFDVTEPFVETNRKIKPILIKLKHKVDTGEPFLSIEFAQVVEDDRFTRRTYHIMATAENRDTKEDSQRHITFKVIRNKWETGLFLDDRDTTTMLTLEQISLFTKCIDSELLINPKQRDFIKQIYFTSLLKMYEDNSQENMKYHYFNYLMSDGFCEFNDKVYNDVIEFI